MGECHIFADNHGVLGLPTYLLVAITVATTILAVFLFTLTALWSDAQLYQVSQELDKIITEAELMFEYADEGTRTMLQVEFPSSLQYVVLGGLPTNSISEPTNLTLNETTSNNYYFVMDTGHFQTAHTHVRFAGETVDQMALLLPGSYTICLELVKYEGKTYVTIFSA